MNGTTHGTNTTGMMTCARCGTPTNPGYWVDGQMLCRICARMHAYDPMPTLPCPFCNGTGRSPQ